MPARQIATIGPWPFITRREFVSGDRRVVWHSRAHRKWISAPFAGAWPPLRAMLWSPGLLNWWIGIGFAIGSALFAAGSILSLVPALARPGVEVNAVYFIGSIFFTAAAWLQLYQAANAGEPGPEVPKRRRWVLIGWRPGDIGWLSCFLQFLGSLLFNLNTYDAMAGTGDRLWPNLTIWTPDAIGSVLFLLSGYLAFIEANHRHWAWQPDSLTWWIVFTNLLGCIAFMISAVFSYVPSGGAGTLAVTLSAVFTLIGAVGFLAGALLLLPEGTADA